ncbi:substrate-binding domain-containing protein [bacterium]|nr:substrate-binding domain-containing protein [bacterium]
MVVVASCASGDRSEIDQLLVEDESIDAVVTISEPESSKLRVALVMKTLTNPFFVEMEKGARLAQSEFDIELTVKTGAKETSIEQQIVIVRQLVEDGVDAIVIAPASSTELVPVLAEAQAAGLPIVNIDNRLDPELSAKMGLVDVPFISVNNEQGAYLSAQALVSHFDGPTQVAILEGIRSADNGNQRKAGAMRAFAEHVGIEVVVSETANWKIDEAYNVIGSMLIEYPDIKGVFCANDMMALGVLQYLQEQGRTDVLVAAFDALDEAKAVLGDGVLVATIDQQAALQGYKGIEVAMRLLHGEQIRGEEFVDVLLVTAETLTQ